MREVLTSALIIKLLQRDPRKRLGCLGTGGLEGFKRHPWFQGYDWTVIERKEAIPPFEPDVRLSASSVSFESVLTPPSRTM